MRFEAGIDVSAPAHAVFETYADVERWPSWTSSVTSVELLTPGPFRVTPTGDHGTRVDAILEQAGPLGPLVGLLTRRLTKRYLDTEVRGLKAYCEA